MNTKYLTVSERLRALADGKRLRRSCWATTSFIFLSDEDTDNTINGVMLSVRGDLRPFPLSPSLFDSGTLWEIYPGPKKLWRRPIKFRDNSVKIDPVWFPTKEEFMAIHKPVVYAFGPWESRDDNIKWKEKDEGGE